MHSVTCLYRRRATKRDVSDAVLKLRVTVSVAQASRRLAVQKWMLAIQEITQVCGKPFP